MGSPRALLERLERFDPDRALDEALEENLDGYLALQKQQLRDGINRFGTTIKPTYASPYYGRMKNRLNSAPGLGNPDLILTGDRNEAMKVTLDRDAFKLDSDVEYNKFLEEHYGPKQIWGLSDTNIKPFRFDVWTSLQVKITNETGLL